MPEFSFWSVFTHEASNSPWQLDTPAELRPVFFGQGSESLHSDRLSSQSAEWRKGGSIVRWLRETGIDAVVLGGYNDAGRLRILEACRRLRIPCFIFGDSNVHCDKAEGLRKQIKGFFLENILGRASGVFACGSLGEKYFAQYGVRPERLFRFPYEPDYEKIRRIDAATVDSVRRQYGMNSNCSYLFYSGRLAPEKRVDLLLKAFQRIAGERPEWGLILAGDGPLKSSLQTLVRGMDAGRVIWTGFINDPEIMRALYAATDVLVLPSSYEPWGVVVTEAAVRMPVVASSVVGAAADVIEDGVNGRIFASGDQHSLEECLLDVTNAETLARMKAAVPAAFERWHRASDPVAGLRRALASVSLSVLQAQ